jgi:hypothetical protein
LPEKPRIAVPAGRTIYKPDETVGPDGVREPGTCEQVTYPHTVQVIPTAASHQVRGGKVMVTWGREGRRRCALVDVTEAISANAPGWG